ncbi:MAG: 6-bladed beta-propeller [Gemmatimonadota bacterium]
MTMRGRLIVLLVVCVGACTDDRPPAATEVRDSAGVRIVQNHRPAWSSSSTWRLSSEPAVDFGPADTLYRIGPIVRLNDGRIVVANGSSSELRVYSADGKPLRRIGREGAGPGEFRDISRMFAIANDSLLVFDILLRRASVFDPQGEFARAYIPPSLPNAAPMIEGRFGDGTLLVASQSPPTPDRRGLVRNRRSLWRLPEGAAAIQLAETPGREIFYQELPTGQVDFRRPYFGHAAYHTAGPDRLYWASTDTFEIKVHSLDGKLISLIRKQHDYQSVSPASASPIIEKHVATLSDAATAASVRRHLSSMPVSGHAPALGWPAWASLSAPELQVDADGNLWVVEFFMPDEERNARTVFDRDGVWLGSVRLPPRFMPRQIGSDFILGKWTDDLDVEHVRVYQLIKPGTQ